MAIEEDKLRSCGAGGGAAGARTGEAKLGGRSWGKLYNEKTPKINQGFFKRN
jgi:hypothetical protein